MHRILARVAHERRVLTRLLCRRRRVEQGQGVLVVGPGHFIGPLDAVYVEIIGACGARVGEGLAVFQAGVARESVAVGRGGEQGEGVLEVGLVVDFAGRVEAGFVEVECAEGLGAAVGGAGELEFTGGADFFVLLVDFHGF